MLIFGNPAKIEKANLRLFPTTIRRRHGDLKPKKKLWLIGKRRGSLFVAMILEIGRSSAAYITTDGL